MLEAIFKRSMPDACPLKMCDVPLFSIVNGNKNEIHLQTRLVGDFDEKEECRNINDHPSQMSLSVSYNAW